MAEAMAKSRELPRLHPRHAGAGRRRQDGRRHARRLARPQAAAEEGRGARAAAVEGDQGAGASAACASIPKGDDRHGRRAGDRGEAADRARGAAAARRAGRTARPSWSRSWPAARSASSKTHLPDAAIVRAMPNTPAAIGRGITVAVAQRAASRAAARKLAHALLAATGAVEWIDDEALMDAVTAVSGSGPAYVFLLAEAMAQAGVAAGLPRGARREARARDRRRLRRTAASLAARRRDLAPERHLARRHHRRRARRADGRRTALDAADDQGGRRRDAARQGTGGLTFSALERPRWRH